MALWFTCFALLISVVCVIGKPESYKNCNNQVPTCDGFNCGAGRECYLKETDCCANPPCPKTPACRPSCQVIRCKAGYSCKDGQCIEENLPSDKCAITLCQTSTTCIDGECIPTCEGHPCEAGEECFLQEVQCFVAPCYPIPTCRPVKKCTLIDCKSGHVCSDGECFPDPCTSHKCSSGYECYLEQVQCIRAPCPPIASCQLIDKCSIVRCKGGDICLDGKCIPDPCTNHKCGSGYECYLEQVQCIRAPCPPIASCRPDKRCDQIFCEHGFICSDGKCIPAPCKGYNCSSGYECYLKNVNCLVEPCPPFPGCRPILTCATIKCLSGYYCLDRKCLPEPTCDEHKCPSGQKCYILRTVCDVPPCPPPYAVCRAS